MGFSVIDEQSLRHPRELKTAYPRLDFVESGMRFYNPALGHWCSRDPIGERGGLNLYCFIRNDSVSGVDHLGLWPGFEYCVDAGEPDVLDPQWSYIGVVPVGTSPTAGGAGGSTYNELKVRWTRDFKRKYICCCKETKWVKGVRGYALSMTDGAPYFFYGAPGPWTPIPTGSSLAAWFINTAGTLIRFPLAPWDDTKSDIDAFVSQNTPGASEKGRIIEEPKAPLTWCWW